MFIFGIGHASPLIGGCNKSPLLGRTRPVMCHIDSLPNIVLHKIFSRFSVDYRMNCLELVCKKWRSLQYYDDQKHVNLSDFHRKFCNRGSSCSLERYKRYPILFKKIFKRKMIKILSCVRNHLNQNLESLDVDKFYINEDAMQIICELPLLNQINLSASTITTEAIRKLNKIRKLRSLVICDAQLDLIDFDQLIIHSLKSINPIHISRLPEQFLIGLHSIDVVSLFNGTDLTIIGEKCTNLRRLCLKYCHNVQSDHQIKIFTDYI
uniref:F-box domain-containing protein n=1 Tax=Romanomermis culicivorax TaxID=13658 RepID=A0A915JG35_ROMCU